jgi:anti-sigma factor RsiW
MTCLRENPNGADLLIGYLEGTLSPEDRSALDQHAAACAECRGLLAVQQTLEDEVPEVSAGFDARLYAHIRHDRWSARWRRRLWRPLLPLAAASAILAGTLWVRMPGPEAPVDDPKQASVDRIEIEQLEQVLDDLELLMPLREEAL